MWMACILKYWFKRKNVWFFSRSNKCAMLNKFPDAGCAKLSLRQSSMLKLGMTLAEFQDQDRTGQIIQRWCSHSECQQVCVCVCAEQQSMQSEGKSFGWLHRQVGCRLLLRFTSLQPTCLCTYKVSLHTTVFCPTIAYKSSSLTTASSLWHRLLLTQWTYYKRGLLEGKMSKT